MREVKITPAIGAGAYVTDVDLTTLDNRAVINLRQALGRYGVLFFRDQTVTPEQHIALAEKFGVININRFFEPLPEFPKIAQVLKEPAQTNNIGEKWHTDHSYDQIPALGSILVGRELPTSGGDTIFVNMLATYEGLSDSLKQKIHGLKAIHSSRHVFGKQALSDERYADLSDRLGNQDLATQDAVHPLVIKHPFSGIPALYVNPQFTVRVQGMSDDDSDELLNILYDHCFMPCYQHRFQWLPGSIAFWDNRATWHSAQNDYPNQRRFMHRITIEGSALEALQ